MILIIKMEVFILQQMDMFKYVKDLPLNTSKNSRLHPTMAISNCLFSPTSENPRGFSVWCVLAKLSTKPRNYS